MTLLELARLGHRMRRAQKRYFRERSEAALALSMELEREFDEATSAILSGRAQGTLFGESGEGR